MLQRHPRGFALASRAAHRHLARSLVMDHPYKVGSELLRAHSAQIPIVTHPDSGGVPGVQPLDRLSIGHWAGRGSRVALPTVTTTGEAQQQYEPRERNGEPLHGNEG